jgi:HEAT repeat protein
LHLLPCILAVEYPTQGVELAQRWLSALATNYPAPEEDLGDQGLALALTSLRDLNEVQIWREAATHELERMMITTWIERICEAGTQKHECRLKRLYGLARAISTLDSPTILFAAHSLQARFSESLRQGLDLRHDLEGALEFLFDSVPNEIVLTLLSQDYPDGGWGSMRLEHALFLRGAQAPRDGLIEIACSAEQAKAGRECALRSLRLLGLLDDVQMRGSALWALSTQGTHVPAEIFQRYLAEQDEFLHRSAMAGLTAPGRPESRGMLLKALQDKNKFVRTDAIWALCRLGKDAPVDSIVTMMHDQESFVRKEAVYALSSLGKQAPVAAFLAATKDEDMFVRQAAVDILGSLDETPPVEQMLNLLQQRAEPFTTIAPNSLRLAAIRALERAGNPVSMAALRETLEDHDPHVVLAAVEALQHLGEQPSLQSLLTHPALTLPRFRSPLIRAIGRLGEQPMRAVLLQSAQQPPVWVQIAAVEVLAECDTVDAAELLRVALQEKHVLVKVAAMAAMSKHQDLRAEIPLDRFFQYLHSQHMRLQGSARRALWTMGPLMDLPIEALLALLELPAGFPLAHVLGDNCQKIPVESVRGLLTSKQPRMRARAIEMLGKRGENAPVDLLVPMLQDEDNEVRFIVTETLGTLGKRIPVGSPHTDVAR